MRLVGVLAAGLIVAVAAAQPPTSPRLIGKAAPPASIWKLAQQEMILYWRPRPLGAYSETPCARDRGTAAWWRIVCFERESL